MEVRFIVIAKRKKIGKKQKRSYFLIASRRGKSLFDTKGIRYYARAIKAENVKVQGKRSMLDSFATSYFYNKNQQ